MCVITRRVGIPLLLLYRTNATSASWACHCIKTLGLINVVSTTLATNTSLVMPQTLKQTTQYLISITYEF